jgi:hypothetical protein
VCAVMILTIALRQRTPTGQVFAGLAAEPATADEVVHEPPLRRA